MKRLLPVILGFALVALCAWWVHRSNEAGRQPVPPGPAAGPAEEDPALLPGGPPPDDPAEAARFWAEALGSPHPAVRRRAAASLGAMGVIRAAQMQALTARMQDPDPGVRLAVANAVKEARVCNSDELIEIIGDLRGADPYTRAGAARRLWGMSAQARPAVPILSRFLVDPSRAESHYSILCTLDDLGRDAFEAVPAIRHALAHSSPEGRARATYALLAVEGPQQETWIALSAALRDVHGEVRWSAAEILLTERLDPDTPAERPDPPRLMPPILLVADSGADAFSPVRALFLPLGRPPMQIAEVAPLIENGDAGVRVCAAVLLLRIVSRPNPELVLEPLLGLLRHRYADVRWNGARALGSVAGKDVARSAPALARALADVDSAVQDEASDQLGALGGGGRPAVPALFEVIEGGSAIARGLAAGALSVILLGREERTRWRGKIPLSPEIERALAAPEFVVEAIWAEDLARWGTSAVAAIPGLTVMVRYRGEETKQVRAIHALRTFGRAAAESAPVLVEATAVGGSASVRGAALEALAEIDPGVDGAAAAGRTAMADPDHAVRVRGAGLVLAGAPKDEAALRLLREVIASPDGTERDAAVRALGRVMAANPEVIPTLAGLLTDKTPATLRRLAAESLASGGSTLPSAREAIAKGLADPDATVALAALAALERSVTDPRALFDWARAAAASPDALVREDAVQRLGRLHPRCREAIDSILPMLSDPARNVRNEAALVLMRLGAAAPSALPALVKALPDGDRDFAEAAAEAVYRIGTREAVASLFDLSGRPAAEDRPAPEIAREVLLRLGPRASVILPEVLATLDNPKRRAFAAKLIGRIGPEARGAIPELARALRVEDPWTQPMAVGALEQIGSESTPVLEEALIQPNPTVRLLAAGALLRLDRTNPRAMPLILKYLEFEDDDVRRAAIREVGRIGEAAADAVPALAREVSEKRWGDDEAVEALGQLGPAAREGVPALLTVIESSTDHLLFASALRALSRIGLGDKRLMPRFRELAYGSTDGPIVMASAACWLIVDPESAEGLRILMAGLGSEDSSTREEAARAFERIGPLVASRAVPSLIAMTAEEGGWASRMAGEALGRIGPEARSAVPTLTWMLGDPGTAVVAAEALGRIGPDAKDAPPELQLLLDDARGEVRRAAREAMRRIEGR